MTLRLVHPAPPRALLMLGMLLMALAFAPVDARAQEPPSKDPPPSAAPVVAKQTGPGEITVTWKAVPNATGYAIGRSVWPNGYQRFRPNYPAENKLIDKEITPGVAHRYSVIAFLPNERRTQAAASNPLTPVEDFKVKEPDPAPGGGGNGGNSGGGNAGGGDSTPGGGGNAGGGSAGSGGGISGGGGNAGGGNAGGGNTGGGNSGGGTGTPGGTENTGGNNGGGTGGGTTAAAASGKFRVTVAGFRVLQETYDNPLQIDGQRDEVFITVNVTDLNPTPKGTVNRAYRTRTFGDTASFSSRIKAGTSHDKGGLRSGDTYLPGPKESVGSTDRLPLRIFDGELVQGGPTAIITPVIWEEDLRNSALSDWNSALASSEWVDVLRNNRTLFGNRRAGAIAHVALNMADRVATVVPGIGSMLGKFLDKTMDRPIGLELINGTYIFNPRVIPLSYELADQLVREKGNGTWARIEIPFEDNDHGAPGGGGGGLLGGVLGGGTSGGAQDPKGAANTSRLGGRYVLYLDVERVP